jgi:Ca2+-binding RTX toxin-like protein
LYATIVNNANAGKSFVVFGKTDTKSVDLTNVSAGEGIIAHTIDFQGDTGTSKNDTLTGTSNDELFVAGLGDDILTGNGGTDVFNAGAGDDTIIGFSKYHIRSTCIAVYLRNTSPPSTNN